MLIKVWPLGGAQSVWPGALIFVLKRHCKESLGFLSDEIRKVMTDKKKKEKKEETFL